MKKLLVVLLFPGLLFAAHKNVIFLIPDGTGVASLTAARQLKGEPLALDSVVNGLIETRSANNSVTDSAAAATAMACGQRTNNAAVAVDVHQVPLMTMGEWFHQQGKAVGIVTTDMITGATPAGFSAHALHRNQAGVILEQQISSGFEVFMGGGRKDLTPERAQLLKEFGYTEVTNANDMKAVTTGKLFGLFNNATMTPMVDRRDSAVVCTEPTLTEMAHQAITLLSQDPDGFFLMIEGAQVDKGNHANDLPWATYEMVEFDNTVEMVLKWASTHPDTLVFISPDHETGGLTLIDEPREGARKAALEKAMAKNTGKPADYFAHYSTTWHSGVDVFSGCSDLTIRPVKNYNIPGCIADMKVTALTEIPTDKIQGLRPQIDGIYIPSTQKWYQRVK